jgi:hypothetical protein
MRLDDLDEIVDPLVLLRGRDYHLDGRVVALEQTSGNVWSAEVEGTHLYDVQVEWDSEGEFSCACTCPYDWGPVCKHVIAVLFAIEDAHPEAFTGETIQMPYSKSEQVRAILEGLPREVLVDILAGLAEDDRGISLDLRARYGEGAPDKAAYLRMAREALRLGQDRHGFLDYWGASRASHGLDSLLSRAGTLLRGGQADRAVPIAQAVLETTAKAYDNADDSMGTLGDCIRIALNILAEAGNQIGEEQRRVLLDYCLALAPVEPYCDYGWGWDLAQIAADLIARPEERTRVFAQLDAMAERRAGESAGLRYHIDDSDRETAALIKLSVVEREDGLEAGLRFIQDHIHLHAFRRRLIEHHLERGELVKVKRLCTDWLEEHASTWFGYRRYYLDTLLEVAQRENNTKEILRLARSLFQNSGDFDYYELIKEKLPAQEWLEVLHELIEELKAGAKEWFTLAGIYAREDMWVELLEIVLRAGEPMLERYRGVLEPRYPEEVSKAYEGIVYEMLVRTSNRGVYARAAEFLQRMTAMGYGGRVEEIIDDLIVKHRRRRAMIEELEAVRPNKA